MSGGKGKCSFYYYYTIRTRVVRLTLRRPESSLLDYGEKARDKLSALR